MNRHDWEVCNVLALAVLERFAQAVEDREVGDGNGFDFIKAAADLVAGTSYEPAHVMQCIIEELIERSMLALADAPSKIYWEGEE